MKQQDEIQNLIDAPIFSKKSTEIGGVIGYERLASLAGQEFMPYFNPRGTEDGQHHTLNVPREVRVDTKLTEFHLLKVTPNLSPLLQVYAVALPVAPSHCRPEQGLLQITLISRWLYFLQHGGRDPNLSSSSQRNLDICPIARVMKCS
ncbi:hypothetical protein U0070_018383 [Myodes glareolus]|uniref:Uncharacterized protein n=1 Tax=Myodes glareolus TaxID=447135 RepID=A0AAW0JUG2_MYOGA